MLESTQLQEKQIINFVDRYMDTFLDYLPQLLSSILIFFVGLFVIRFIKNLINKIFEKRNVEITLRSFLLDIFTWTFRVLLTIVVISQLGIQTTSFVAMIGAAGLAVGLALQGSLANFAGGVLIILFKPFRVGDTIKAQAEEGVVKEINIFSTKLITSNNQIVFIPNGKLSNDTIVNFTVGKTRRSVFRIIVSYNSDVKKAKEILISLMKNHKDILQNPSPNVVVSELAENGIFLSVTFWAKNEKYTDSQNYILEESIAALQSQGIKINNPKIN